MTDKSAKALWFDAPGRPILKSENLDQAMGQLLLKSRYSAVSSGTERLVLAGDVPPELHDSMQVPFMGGSFDFPVKYGYSLVAEIVGGPKANQIVHLMHPHQDFICVPEDVVTLMPKALPTRRGVLISNLETALTATWDAELVGGQKTAVIGFGFIGSLTAQIARLVTGIPPAVLELDENRRQAADQLGFTLLDKPELNNYDVCFHCSARADGLNTAISMVKPESAVVELSWYGNKKVSVDLGSSFHYGRKKIVASQVAHIPPRKQNQYNYKSRKTKVLELLDDAIWDQWLEPPLAEIIPFFKIPELFSRKRWPLVPIIQYEEI